MHFDGRSLLELQAEWDDQRWLVAVVMLLVGSAAMLVDLALEATINAWRDHAPWWRTVVDEVRSAAGLATALVTSGPLIALAEYALGLWALPLFLFPLVLTYFAVQRFANVRATYRQTIGALSVLTERTGYTVSDHAQRVSETAVAIGRDLGLAQRELTDLEYAALLHDLGQIALREPIPGGATLLAAPADQQRIAHDGAEIVRSTGVLDNVADILEAQTTPFRQVRELGQDLPMSSRIIKVANAYEDLVRPRRRRRRARHGADPPRARLRVRPPGRRLADQGHRAPPARHAAADVRLASPQRAASRPARTTRHTIGRPSPTTRGWCRPRRHRPLRADSLASGRAGGEVGVHGAVLLDARVPASAK